MKKISLCASAIALVLTLMMPNQLLAGTVKTDGADIIISTKSGLKITTADGMAQFQLGGRLQWDYDATAADGRPESDDFDVRRARIYVKGTYGDWGYKAQFNVAESNGTNGGSAEDLYIRYKGFGDLANLTIGKQKEPFGLEEMTSSKDISALERSAMTEKYARGKNAGVQLHGVGKNWTYGIGVFEADGDKDNDFANIATTARVIFTPLKSDDALVHIGVGYTDVNADIATDESDALGFELAGTYKSLHAQAEYFDGTQGNIDVDGFYVQLGWIITGETRPYKNGVFKRVKPSRDSGAWEAVLRYEDGDGKYSDIGLGSGDGEQTTVGINYYANTNVRLGFSYMDGEIVDTSGSTISGDEMRLRVQLTY